MKTRFVPIVALAMTAALCLSGCARTKDASQEDAATETETVRAEAQSLGLTGVGNARELGGYATESGKTVKRGVLLRSATLSGATEEDMRRLREDYHLSVLVDFRMSDETAEAPEPEIPGVTNLWLPIIDEAAYQEKMASLTPEDTEGLDLTNKLDRLKLAMKLGLVGERMYVEFLSSKQGMENYGRLFQELLALPEGEALLFHCSQGKDRTGLAAMLILSALGADEETVLADFLLTNVFNAGLIENERRMLTELGYEGAELDAMMKAMDEVSPQYMQIALDWMKENYGSVTGYVTNALGVGDDQLETLRAKYLEA